MNLDRKRSTYAVGVCALALAVSACGSSSASKTSAPGVSKTSITLGTTSPLTGAVASLCKPVSDGAKAWFSQVNSQGGVHGRKINDTVLDDGYQAPQAVANVRQFIQQPVFAVFGGCGSIQPAAIGPQLNGAGVPYLFPYAGLKSLLQPVQKSTFAILPLFGSQGAALIKYAFKQDGPGSVMSVFSRIPDINEQIGVEKDATLNDGGKWLESEITTAGTTDYTPTALRIKAKNPDYIVMSVPPSDALRILQALSTQGFTPKKSLLGTSTLAHWPMTRFLSLHLPFSAARCLSHRRPHRNRTLQRRAACRPSTLSRRMWCRAHSASSAAPLRSYWSTPSSRPGRT